MPVRSTRALVALAALLLLVTPVRAAADKAAAPGNLVGTWTITGPGVGGDAVTMAFAAPDQLTVVRVGHAKRGGDVRSQSLGPDWKLAGTRLTFTGSMYSNDFEIKGVWTLAWTGPDKVAATTGAGKTYLLERVTAAPTADTPAGGGAAASTGNLIGAWTMTGPGIGARLRVTMEFDAPDRLTVLRLTTRDTGTMSPGPRWKLSGGKLAFADTLAEDEFEVAGVWSLAWDGPDKVTATTAEGKTYHLARAAAAATTDKPATKPADRAAAAKPTAVPGDPVGTWTITGPGLDGVKATLLFAKPDTVTLVRVGRSKTGDVRSTSTGPTWRLSGGGDTIVFRGSLAADDFKIKGDWALAWEGPDKFTATTGRGKQYHLARVTAK